jgi:predicted CXXCH cytochrome family protein
MNQRLISVSLIIAVFLILPLVSSSTAFAASDKDFKLKPEARGKLCLNCHIEFSDKLKKRFVHTPVKDGDCTGCHNPHASDHGKLLAGSEDKICSLCHSTMIPKDARSSHKVVEEGKCILCHDPHAADNKNNLVKTGNELCFSCHENMAGYLKNLSHPHEPVSDCLSCHDPHSSTDGDFMLAANPPDLCQDCHDIKGKQLEAAHMGYPVGKASCITCHNPHGSNQNAILYDQVHNPVAKRMCNQCHEAADSANPLATKRSGFELCRGCHNDTVNDILGADRLHWPVISKDGCLSCHNPHAAQKDNLLRGSLLKVCGSCHQDTLQRMVKSETKHEPIAKGECSSCHNPHSSNNKFLFTEPTTIKLCGKCHEWMTHSSHPLGEKYNDPRNENLKVNCLSCHRAHGTEYEKMIPYPTITNLCTQCHEKFRR